MKTLSHKEMVKAADDLERAGAWAEAREAWDAVRKASKTSANREIAKSKMAVCDANIADAAEPLATQVQRGAFKVGERVRIHSTGEVGRLDEVDGDEALVEVDEEFLHQFGDQDKEKDGDDDGLREVALSDLRLVEDEVQASEDARRVKKAALEKIGGILDAGEEAQPKEKPVKTKTKEKKAPAAKPVAAKTAKKAPAPKPEKKPRGGETPAVDAALEAKLTRRAKQNGLKDGQVLEHSQRGAVTATCTYHGPRDFRYRNKKYTSISAAANAAAEHLEMKSRSLNGWVFWGVEKREGDV